MHSITFEVLSKEVNPTTRRWFRFIDVAQVMVEDFVRARGTPSYKGRSLVEALGFLHHHRSKLRIYKVIAGACCVAVRNGGFLRRM